MIGFYVAVGIMIAYTAYWNYDFYYHYKRKDRK